MKINLKILIRFLNRFSDGLKGCRMNNAVWLVNVENFFKFSSVADVRDDHRGAFARKHCGAGAADPAAAWKVLEEGAQRVRPAVEELMGEVRRSMHVDAG